jgi:hypothetical protein
MFDFAAKHFRGLVELSLWVFVIGSGIFGIVVGWRVAGAGGVPVGLLIGFAGSLLCAVLPVGLLALFHALCKDVKNMNKWLQYMWENEFNSDAIQKRPRPLYDKDVHYFNADV